MSLDAYIPLVWVDYADSPDLSAANLNHLEQGIKAVTDELLAFEASWVAAFQPISAELTAVAGISTTGYVKRTGSAAWTTTASIPVADISGVLPVANGGTGQSSYTAGDLLYASSSTALARLPDVATGNVLRSGGVGAAPAWGKVSLASDVSGTLQAAQFPALTGDVTTSAGGLSTTLASIIAAAGPVGGGATVPVITYDAKGRLTAVSTASITPAGIGALPASGGLTNKLAKWTSSSTLSSGIITDDGDWIYADPGVSSGGRFKARASIGKAQFVGNTPGDWWGIGSYSSGIVQIGHCSSDGVWLGNAFSFVVQGSFGVTGNISANGAVDGGLSRMQTSAISATQAWFGYAGLNTAGAYRGFYAGSGGDLRIASAGGTSVSIGTGASYNALVVSDTAVTLANPLSGTSAAFSGALTVGASTAMLKRVSGVLTDAVSGTDYLPWGSATGTVDLANVNSRVAGVYALNGTTWGNAPSGILNSSDALLLQSHVASSGVMLQILSNHQSYSDGNLWFRRSASTSGTGGTWFKVWHDGNLSASTLPGGPYIPLAGGVVVSGFLNMYADIYVNAGHRLRCANWYTTDSGIFSTSSSFVFDSGTTVAMQSAEINGTASIFAANIGALSVSSSVVASSASFSAPAATSPGYGPDILTITWSAPVIFLDSHSTKFRQYILPTSSVARTVTLIFGPSASANPAMVYMSGSEVIYDKGGNLVCSASTVMQRWGAMTIRKDTGSTIWYEI